MNNPNKDDFERMVQLAEFGARRHDERRQVEFRVFRETIPEHGERYSVLHRGARCRR